MVRHLKNKTAMTLVELITATILVGIVMLGIVAIELAMRRTFSTTSKSAALSMKVSAAMIHFSRNISQAIGDRNDQGILDPVVVNGSDSCTKLYVRKDTDGSPVDYSDDTWMRYQHDHSTTNASLMFCDNIGLTGSQDPITDDVGCAGACSGNSYELLNVRALTYERVADDINLQYYTEVNLTTYSDNTQIVPDPILNPQIENMQTKISYMSHSW